ncbi:MAG: hypothetical protein QNJ47_03690 [Nostocaceae cyanobacterium]|nr:hypothetical protein [Nostocaceae cyanobacterium]
MSKKKNQRREFDAVLSGEISPPATGVVLGGIEGVKRRFQSEDEEVRIAALYDTLNYGNEGLDFVIEALEDDSQRVRDDAAYLLRNTEDEKAKQALFDYNPWLAFTKLTDWKSQEINFPQKINNWRPQVFYYPALYCYNPADDCLCFFVENQDCFPNLKALFWGCSKTYTNQHCGYHNWFFDGYAYYDGYVYQLKENMSPILEAYPDLQLLHIRGAIDNKFLEESILFTRIQHHHLKTLILETPVSLIDSPYDSEDVHYFFEENGNLGQLITKDICTLDLPNLEYLEMWVGYSYKGYEEDKIIANISEYFPNLKYLGIHYIYNTNLFVEELVKSSLIEPLRVLEITDGDMTDEGLEYLLNSPDVNNLHTLNISRNYISSCNQSLKKFACQQVVIESKPEFGYYDEDLFNQIYE